MSRSSRPFELDFGVHEKTVRLIEESTEDVLRTEIDRRLRKPKPGAVDQILVAAAMAAVRSTRFEGNGRVPHGLLALPAARSLMTGVDPDSQRLVLSYAVSLIHREIHHPGFGPYRLLDFREEPGEGKEGTLFSFLEAARAGETDWADHRFAWLVRNLERDQVIDCLLSSGLEGVTAGVHRVTGVVEVNALLQGLGWEWASLWLRPIVRHQASGVSGQAEYEGCREMVARRDLLRLARRRPPGQPSFGERDPERFLHEAEQWAEAGPPDRTHLMSRLLVEGHPLEDAGDVLATGAVLLYLQEMLRPGESPSGSATALLDEETDRRAHIVTGVLALRQLVRLGTPGQRILALLLAGWIPPVRLLRFNPVSADGDWWATASRLLEGTAAEGAGAAAPAWEERIAGGRPEDLLSFLSGRLEAGAPVEPLLPSLRVLKPCLDRVPGMALKLDRTLAEAYRNTRSPHRWLFVWAAGLALCLWPRGESGVLHETGGAATITP